MMKKLSGRYEIRLSGSGGQGLVLAGIILGEATSIYQGYFVTQTQSYGPESRGGASKSDVVISDREIDYPKAIKLDLLLALTQESCDKYLSSLKPGGLLIVDDLYVTEPPKWNNMLVLPLTRTARTVLKREIVTNIISLGALAPASGIVEREAIEKAVLARVPKGTEELNKQALQEGFRLVDEARKNNQLKIDIP